MTGRRASDHGLIGVTGCTRMDSAGVNCLDGSRDKPTGAAPARPTRTRICPRYSPKSTRRLSRCRTNWPHCMQRGGPAVAGCDTVLPLGTRSRPSSLPHLRADLVLLGPRHAATGTAPTARTAGHRRPERARRPAVRRRHRGGAVQRPWTCPHRRPRRRCRRSRQSPRSAGCRPVERAGCAGSTLILRGPTGSRHGWPRDPVRVRRRPGHAGSLGDGQGRLIGQHRMGEIVPVAQGPDVPGPDSSAAYEHGSMTAEEILIPFMTWPGG